MENPMSAGNSQLVAAPFFSIVMPCFNSEKYLEGSIRSVLDQAEKDFELIVVDDGSEDNSREIVKTFALADSRVQLVLNSGGSGAAGARNYGVSLSRGKWLCFLDSDDQYVTDALSLRKTLISNQPECQFFSSDFLLWSGQSEDRNISQTESNEFWAFYFCQANRQGLHLLTHSVTSIFVEAPLAWTGGVSMKRELFMELEGFDETLTRAEDDHLWVRAAAKSGAVGLINHVDVYYRLRSSGLSQGGGSLTPYTPIMIKKLMRDPLLAGFQKQLRSKLELETYLLSLHYRSKGARKPAIRYAFESYWLSLLNYRKLRNLIGALLLKS
jgi:glycosyltransferase involved in cell wall biosynthesis